MGFTHWPPLQVWCCFDFITETDFCTPSSSPCKAWPKWRCVGTANCSWPLLKLKDPPAAPRFCFCHHWLVQPSFLFRIITESLISISLSNTELLGATIFPAGWLALRWIPQNRTESNTPPYVSPNTTLRTFRHLLPIFYNCRWSMQGQLGQFDFYGLTCCHRRGIRVVSTTAVVQRVLFTGNRTSSHTHTVSLEVRLLVQTNGEWTTGKTIS